jgi:hypothetical protein
MEKLGGRKGKKKEFERLLNGSRQGRVDRFDRGIQCFKGVDELSV